MLEVRSESTRVEVHHQANPLESARPAAGSSRSAALAAARRRRRRDDRPGGRSVATLGVAVLALLCCRPQPAATAADGPEAVEPSNGTHPGGVGPVADWLGDLIDVVEEAKKELEDAEDEASSSGQVAAGPSRLLIHVDRADALVAQILDPSLPPSLTPAGAGSVDTSVRPTTLAGYAAACRALVTEAYVLILSDPVQQAERIGSDLKTIRHLIPEYRRLAQR
jgi:hypothetical protein